MYHGCRVSSIVLAVVTLLARAAATIPPEEMTVRSTYAKAMVAFEIEQVSPALYGEQDKFTKTEHLQVDVSIVKVGPIQEILQTNVEDLVTKPGGYILDATVVMADIAHSGKKRDTFKSLTVPAWHVVPPLTQDWAVPVSEEMELAGKDFSRYASFDVTLTYMGRQRQYKALFLFGADSSGKEDVYAVDFVLGMNAVNQLVSAPIQQEVQFLQQNFGAEKHVRTLLRSVQPQVGCESDSKSEFCCHSATGHCGVKGLAPLSPKETSMSFLPGVHASDTVPGLAQAAPQCVVPGCSAYDSFGPVLNIADDGNMGHWFGTHTGSTTSQGKCTYDGNSLPCTPVCHVSIATPSTDDTRTGVKGFPLYYHSISYNRAIIEGINSCTSYVGFGGIQCHVLFNCTLTISVGGAGVTVSPKDQEIWSTGNHPTSYQCSTIQ